MNKERTIYMDYQASTPIHQSVLEAMMPYLTQDYGNPHSAEHIMGWNASKAIDNAKKKVANAIGAQQDEIIFTSGATEANNHAIVCMARAIRSHKKKILIGATEHKCVIEAARFASEQYDLSLEIIPVNNEGFIDLESFKRLLDDDVGLVSVMLVNNEVGTIQDKKILTNLAKHHDVVFHCDAAQGMLALDVDVSDLGVDLLSLSAHKIYGPKGVGALFISNGIINQIERLIYGGSQQSGLRAGTLPTAQCVGFGSACESLVNMEEERARLRRLKKTFISNLAELTEIEVNGPNDFSKCHPGNVNVYFPSVDANTLLMKLQPELCASSGSACNSGFIEPSYVIRALGYDRDRAEKSVRFSMGYQTTESDVYNAVTIIGKALSNL